MAEPVIIGIDKGHDDTTVYTIPHKEAFRLLERQICAEFHPTGEYATHTRAEVNDGDITFVVQVRQTS